MVTSGKQSALAWTKCQWEENLPEDARAFLKRQWEDVRARLDASSTTMLVRGGRAAHR
jgi:hypothetical protein